MAYGDNLVKVRATFHFRFILSLSYLEFRLV